MISIWIKYTITPPPRLFKFAYFTHIKNVFKKFPKDSDIFRLDNVYDSTVSDGKSDTIDTAVKNQCLRRW